MVLDRVISADEFKLMSLDFKEDEESIIDLISKYKIFGDKSSPDYQVDTLLEQGENLDNYHWEKAVYRRGTDRWAGAKLVKNYVEV